MTEKKLCGHKNYHVYGQDGKPKPIACELEEGHEGDHFSSVVGNGYWNDAAGKPVKEAE